MKERTLWAVKIGDADWQEELITSTTSKEHLNKAKDWATANGFNRLRVSEFDITVKPNFVQAIVA